MNEITISAPAHLQSELQDIADSIGVSLDALAAYFFAREVVHT